MRSHILKGVLLIAAFITVSALTVGDAVSAASRQSAVVWLKEPKCVGSDRHSVARWIFLILCLVHVLSFSRLSG